MGLVSRETGMLGSANHPPREVVWYLAKFTRDLARGEQANVGLIVRRAESDALAYRFLPPGALSVARKTDAETYLKQVGDWSGQMDRYQARCLIWLPKRRPFPPFRIELAGRKIAGGRIDFDRMFGSLVGSVGEIGVTDAARLADYVRLTEFLADRFPDEVERGESPADLAIRLILGQGGSRLPLPED